MHTAISNAVERGVHLVVLTEMLKAERKLFAQQLLRYEAAARNVRGTAVDLVAAQRSEINRLTALRNGVDAALAQLEPPVDAFDAAFLLATA